jgi:hypothetical protein
MTLLGIISVGFNVNRSTADFLHSTDVKKYNETAHQLFIDFSDNFVIQNIPKGAALSSQIFNFALGCN